MIDEKVKVVNLEIKNKRVLVMADVHGTYSLIDEILKKNIYNKEEDLLFILGDLSRKGPYPLKTLRYIMELAKNPNVYVTLGNCDEADLYEVEPKYVKEFKDVLTRNCLAHDYLKELFTEEQLIKFTDTDFKNAQELLYNKEEYQFLRNLPHVIETEDYIFTHAGLPRELDYNKNSYKEFIRGRKFFKESPVQNKKIVLGHMPTTIFKANYYNNNILFDDRNLIMIDGGLVVYNGGQLNLLEIRNNIPKMLDSVDNLKKRKVIKRQHALTYMKGTCWPFYKIKVLEKLEEFSICEILETLEITLIKNEYLNDTMDETKDDCPGMLIDVNVGDIVSIINKLENYSLVKSHGILGWISNECLGEEI